MTSPILRVSSIRKGLTGVVLGAALLTLAPLPPCTPPEAHAARASQKKATATVYEKQPPVQEKELLSFLELLPAFRSWAQTNQEEAHPVQRQGKPDFLYSPNAAQWVKEHGWQPVRFFCVMGRMAAALVIVAEGNDMGNTRPPDMPPVSESELHLARRHMGAMLQAGGHAPPIRVE